MGSFSEQGGSFEDGAVSLSIYIEVCPEVTASNVIASTVDPSPVSSQGSRIGPPLFIVSRSHFNSHIC